MPRQLWAYAFASNGQARRLNRREEPVIERLDSSVREPEIAYSACFDPEKELLSPDNTVCFDANAEESVC